jgi:hypothetical protein
LAPAIQHIGHQKPRTFEKYLDEQEDWEKKLQENTQ